jgi:gliding motility-associated-like protein
VFCDPTIISAAQPQTVNQLCIGETISFTENSIGAQSLLWDFGVPGISTDISTLSSPTYTYPDTGVYTVTLIANPTWPCADTSTQVFYVYEPLGLDVEVIDFACLNGIEAFDLQANGSFTDNTNLTWNMSGGLPNSQTGLTTGWVTFANADEWTVTLEAEHYGCESSVDFTWEAPPSPVAAVADQSSFCQGFDFDFDNLSQNAENWYWDFGVAGTNDDTSNEESPSYTYPGDGIYTVELIVTAPFTCSDTVYSTVEIFPEIDPSFEAPDPECFSTHNFTLMPLVENDPITTYEWDFGGPTVSANINGPSVSNLVYAEPGTYTVQVTAIANGCEVTASEEVWVISDPAIGFQGGPPMGCPPHSVSFTNTSQTETATTYLWDFGDGGISSAAEPIHVYENPGSYSVTLTMNASGFCSQQLTLTQSGMVDVLPIPNAGFEITPNQVDILNPVVEFETLATGTVQCFYNFGDGGSSSDCSGFYTYTDGGYFDVTQTVVNDAGCTNTAVGQVAVSGSVFYAPTAFTPDHDGINDVWMPVALGVSEYRLIVYNRWGELIWQTESQEEPWLGQVHDGAHFAPDGLYFYEAFVSDLLFIPQTYRGHLQLLR